MPDLHDDTLAGGQLSFPACLSEPTASIQRAYIASQLDSFLIAHGFKVTGSNDLPLTDSEILK